MITSLYQLQPTHLHSASLDSDSPSIYSQDSPDQPEPESNRSPPPFSANPADEGYSRSPSPGAGSFLTRAGTSSTARAHGPTHFVSQLDTPPASPPPGGVRVREMPHGSQAGSGAGPLAGKGQGPDPAVDESDDGLPGYRRPTVKLTGGRTAGGGPGVGTMIRRRVGAGVGAAGGLSPASEEGEGEGGAEEGGESAGQRAAREAAEAQLARDEMLEKRRVAAERAASLEEDRVTDERAHQAELVKGIENMLADQMASSATPRTQHHSPQLESAQPRPSSQAAPTRFQLHDTPLPSLNTSTPPGWSRGLPDQPTPAAPPLLWPTPRSAHRPATPPNELDYLTAPSLGPPVPAYTPSQPSRGPNPQPPPFVPAETVAAAEARRHPKEAFFSEARRQDFRAVNGLDEARRGAGLGPGVEGERLEGQGPGMLAPGEWRELREEEGWGPLGLVAPPPPFEGGYGQAYPSHGGARQEYDYRPAEQPMYQHQYVHSPESECDGTRAEQREPHRGSYQPPQRVFTPVERGQRPQSDYSGHQSPARGRGEWGATEQDYFGRVDARPGGGGRWEGPPVSSSGGMSGYYRSSGGYGSDTIHEHTSYGPGPAFPGGYASPPLPLGTAGLPHPSEFEHPTPPSRGHHQPYSPVPASRRSSSIPISAGYDYLPPPPAPHPGYGYAYGGPGPSSAASHLLSPGAHSPSARSSQYGHALSPSASRAPPDADAGHAAWQHREFLRWQAEQALQRRRIEAEGEGQTLSSGSVGDSASVVAGGGAGKASRKESIKGLLKGFKSGGKGKAREGEFEEVGERTTILWGWTWGGGHGGRFCGIRASLVHHE